MFSSLSGVILVVNSLLFLDSFDDELVDEDEPDLDDDPVDDDEDDEDDDEPLLRLLFDELFRLLRLSLGDLTKYNPYIQLSTLK